MRYLHLVAILGAADHGVEVGEQKVDGVRRPLSGLQPDLVCPFGAESVEHLPAEVVFMLAEVRARQNPLGAVIRPAQQVGDVPVAPELGDVESGL